ncbi:MAG: hypothetical protein IPK75_19265 [Acidobacteria bacterium]|nr:hypothetical protein [Acidobacteriota bacterium]
MKGLAALVSFLALAACDSGGDAAEPPQASCFERASKRIDAELASIDAHIGPVEELRWLIQVEIADDIANIVIAPVSANLRGGGGKFQFNCASNEWIFVQGFK